MTGLVAGAVDENGGPSPVAALALGLALIPFVFIVLAFMSEHPRAPGAVVKAMAVSILVGVMVSAIAVDGITGLIAGVGAGGIFALRNDGYGWRARAVAVLMVTVWCFVLVRIAGPIALLPAPAMPFTAIGLADHFVERRLEREHEEE